MKVEQRGAWDYATVYNRNGDPVFELVEQLDGGILVRNVRSKPIVVLPVSPASIIVKEETR